MTTRRSVLQGAGALSLMSAMPAELLSAKMAFAQDLDHYVQHHSSGEADCIESYTLVDPRVTYLNQASVGTMPTIVHRAHVRYLEACERNPWLHIWGGAWEEARERVRARAAALLGAEAGNVALTHNATECFCLAAHGLPLGRRDEVLLTSLNHPGARVPWFHVAKKKGFSVREFVFPIEKAPRMSEEDVLEVFDRAISSKTRVLVFPHVDNLIGIRHPVKLIAQLAKDRNVDIVAVDGAQAISVEPLEVSNYGVDIYGTCAHKWLQGPKGTGLLYLSSAVQSILHPMWATEGQERWAGTVRVYEDYGTRNLPEVLALEDAIDFHMATGIETRKARLLELRVETNRAMSRSEDLTWRSPIDNALASALYAFEFNRESIEETVKRFAAAPQNPTFAFRTFAVAGLGLIRLSPNHNLKPMDINSFFNRLLSV